jgi:hypothetical protein
VYSLVSPAELTTALVRHGTALEVTDVLDRALRIDRTDLGRLSLAYRDELRRHAAWGRVGELAGLTAPADEARVGTGPPAGGPSPGAPAVDAAAGRAADPAAARASAELHLGHLLDLVREEVLGWSREQVGDLVIQTDPGGATAVADALGGAWAGADLTPDDRDPLDRPWRTVFGELPVVAGPEDLGANSGQVRQLLDNLVTTSATTLAQLGEAYRLQAPPRPSGVRPWDVAMRRACQASFVTGNVRQVAMAQFAAVRAQLLPGGAAGLPGTPAGDAVAQAVAGTVQAVAMRETLDPVVYRFLVFAWEATLGPIPG